MATLDSLLRDSRIAIRREGQPEGDCIVYWMQRAQRAYDNPALDLAIDLGNLLGKPVVVFLGIVPFYPHANWRHYAFLASGIPDLAMRLAERNVGFVLRPYPDHRLLPFCEQVKAAAVVGDENPLRETEKWRKTVTAQIRIPLYTVDADVVVPSALLLKEQFAARTIRPRIHKLLPEYLVKSNEPAAQVPFKLKKGVHSLSPDAPFIDDNSRFPIDRSVAPIKGMQGGTTAGLAALERFLKHRLNGYAKNRNHPEMEGTSELSPYLHFGHLGPRAVAMAVSRSHAPEDDKAAYLEELIVRRELSINYVRFNERYDSLEGSERWAKATLRKHESDERPAAYSEETMERAETGDPLWNASQRQMVRRGWMHGYMRMYWAKKILEWSPSPARAFAFAVRMNDRYFLDGRDPNGYTGIAWAIGGKHDRPWFERPIFGTVRFMSFASTSKKFDSKRYMAENG